MSGVVPDDESVFALLALHRLLLNKPQVAKALLAQAGTAVAALAVLTRGSLGAEVEAAVTRDLRWLEAPGRRLLTYADFPEALRAVHDPPFLLFAEGDMSRLVDGLVRVAIVGARQASTYGRHQALVISEALSDSNVCVVSGLALGIDASAHEGALRGTGSTIAVLGTGCDRVYPRRNWRLAERIAADGIIISEFPTGTRAYPGHFPRRNRIVTGVSRGIVVVEAAERSGSLISARLAAAEGRDVMAVPGLVSHERAAGCHRLIREGAMLVRHAADVFEELGLTAVVELGLPGPAPDLKPELRALLACLSGEPLSIDEILAELPSSVDELSVSLVSLEVQGLITAEAGRYQAIGN
jgi:DNA processing protein